MALQNKAYLWDHLYTKGGSGQYFRMQVEIFYLHFLSSLPLVQLGKFQCPSSWEFPNFLGTPHIFHPNVILKEDAANQAEKNERWVLLHGTVVLHILILSWIKPNQEQNMY